LLEDLFLFESEGFLPVEEVFLFTVEGFLLPSDLFLLDFEGGLLSLEDGLCAPAALDTGPGEPNTSSKFSALNDMSLLSSNTSSEFSGSNVSWLSPNISLRTSCGIVSSSSPLPFKKSLTMSPKSLVIPSSSLSATCLPASLSRYSTSNTWRGISLPLLSWLQSLKVSPSSQSCLVWQNPNSEQQGANSGQPSGQLTAAALYGGAAQLPGPVPAPSRAAQWGRLWRSSSTTRVYLQAVSICMAG